VLTGSVCKEEGFPAHFRTPYCNRNRPECVIVIAVLHNESVLLHLHISFVILDNGGHSYDRVSALIHPRQHHSVHFFDIADVKAFAVNLSLLQIRKLFTLDK
jgi:hypothetical protein